MRTACTLDCPDTCSLEVESGTKGFRVQGNPDHPFTQGLTCAKIPGYFQRLASPERITSPMVKYGRKWQEISWEDALAICAEQLHRALNEDPRQLVHISGHGARGISKMVVDRFFAALGCTGVRGSLCDGTGIQASILDFGALEQSPLLDMAHSEWIVNWGRDVGRSSIHAQRILSRARRSNTRVVSIWPGGDGFEKFSDQLIRIAPGRDRFLALAVLKVMEDQNSLSAEAVASCRDYAAFRTLLHSFSLDELAAICDVTRDNIYYLAAIYRQHPVATLIGWGVQRYRFGGENVRMLNALAWLSGNVGSQGAGVYFNISSARNFDLSWLPDTSRRHLSWPGLGRDMLQAEDPPLSLAWINGTNPVNQAPESHKVAQALANLDFVIAVDGFWTDTVRRADLVLPCTFMGEEDDVLGSCMHDYVQYARAVTSPPLGVRSDLWIVQQLNTYLGLELAIMDREKCFQRSLAASDPDQAWQDMKSQGYFLARKQEPVFAHGTSHPDGKFHVLTSLNLEPPFEAGYPFRLLSLIRKEAIHSQMLPSEQSFPPKVWVNPDAPGLAGVDPTREVALVSSLGSLRVQVIFDPSLHPEVLIYRRGDWMCLGGGVNQLIQAQVTDLDLGAAQYSQQVALRNIPE